MYVYCSVCSVLLQGGANLNSQDFDGWTPLHAAAHWGQKEACEMLVEEFCDMDMKNYVVGNCQFINFGKMFVCPINIVTVHKVYTRLLVVSISLCGFGFDPSLVCVEFVVVDLALGQIFQVLPFSFITIIPLMLHKSLSITLLNQSN
jgi:FOG: Ankyrin repeat